MKKKWTIPVVVVLIAIALAGSYLLWQRENIPGGKPAASLAPEASVSITPSTTVPQTTQSGIEVNIQVTSPQPNDAVSLPITIKGKARVFENQFNYRIKDQDGSILTEGTATSNAKDVGLFGDFIITVKTLSPKGTKGIIEVFDYSARDGSEEDKVAVPVKFNIKDTVEVKAYFSKDGASAALCDRVFPVSRRVEKTQAIARAALTELLNGPTLAEGKAGYLTNINPGVTIQKLSIANGIARVDFNNTLEDRMGGSCRVTAIRAQIIQTLKQFPTVQDVIISIDGRTEDILQP